MFENNINNIDSSNNESTSFNLKTIQNLEIKNEKFKYFLFLIILYIIQIICSVFHSYFLWSAKHLLEDGVFHINILLFIIKYDIKNDITNIANLKRNARYDF